MLERNALEGIIDLVCRAVNNEFDEWQSMLIPLGQCVDLDVTNDVVIENILLQSSTLLVITWTLNSPSLPNPCVFCTV